MTYFHRASDHYFWTFLYIIWLHISETDSYLRILKRIIIRAVYKLLVWQCNNVVRRCFKIYGHELTIWLFKSTSEPSRFITHHYMAMPWLLLTMADGGDAFIVPSHIKGIPTETINYHDRTANFIRYITVILHFPHNSHSTQRDGSYVRKGRKWRGLIATFIRTHFMSALSSKSG